MSSAVRAQALHFVPLGGSGEIGLNLNLYGQGDAWLMVDCGAGFERAHGGETRVIVPDPRFIVAQRERLAGLVITHIHEDHLGAVADLWPSLRCPVHATPFAAAFLRAKLRARGLDVVPIKEHLPGARFHVGPFDVQFLGITHSTLEAQSVVLRTSAGVVVHTGDFKLDPTPGLGPVTNLGAFKEVGDEGVLAVVADSTNATKPGRSGSEEQVRLKLRELLQGRSGRVVVALFASNVARLGALAHLAGELGRHPVLLGRSLHRMLRAAHETGWLRDIPLLVPARDAGWLPREAVLALATGTQAEPGAALTRLALGTHPDLTLEEGDLVIASSKIIPGNEDIIAEQHALLRAQGVEVIDELVDPGVHASGHPCQDELKELYAALRPTTVVPVHGEPRHLRAHAALARQLGHGVAEVRNGDVVQLGPGPASVLGQVPTGRIVRVEERSRPRGLRR